MKIKRKHLVFDNLTFKDELDAAATEIKNSAE